MNVKKIETNKRVIDLVVLVEIAIVFLIVITVKWVADTLSTTGAGSIAIWVGIISATLFMKKRGIKWRQFGMRLPKSRKEWITDIALAFLSVILVIVFMALILDPFVNYLGLESPPESHDRFAFFLGKPLLFISYLIGVVWFGAALGEELLMRGYVLNRLVNFFGDSKLSKFAALSVQAFIFGLLHAYQGLPGIIGTGMVALIFGTIYFSANQRLFPVIIGHGIINTISLTAYYLSDGTII